ncbi:hypothetical protein, partial [Rikenella microfusus]|uniref:hypothetical protein n=1 Tax=Rikenella microfusus TaxID=28139 RepID=UPI001D8B62F2
DAGLYETIARTQNLNFGLSPSPRGAKRQGDKAGGSANRKTTGCRSDRKSLNKNALFTLAASVVHKENSTLKPNARINERFKQEQK